MIKFTKDLHLDPVDPLAGEAYDVALPLPDPDQELRELEIVRCMAEDRDVPFDQLSADSLAVYQTDVNGGDDGGVVSHFLNASFRNGAYQASTRDRIVCLGEYLTTGKKYDAMLEGDIEPLDFELRSGDIANGRELGSLVHKDWPFQFFARAGLCCLSEGVGRNPGNPIDLHLGPDLTRSPFIDDGIEELFGVMAELHDVAMRYAWAVKWEHRVARPEEMAADRGEYLSLLYPEGAPVHPSYPAGHSVCAGAMVTFLKAWFADQALNDGTTCHAQLNVLAANVADGRAWAGVHKPQDQKDGLKLGERVAKAFLANLKPKFGGADFLPLFEKVTI